MDRAPRVAFAPLSPSSRAALLAIARRTQLPAGSTVLTEGTKADAFYLVWSGQVKMCRLTPAGKNLILSLFGPGDLFGVTPVLSGEVCSASWETLVDSECLEIKRNDLYGLFARHPDLVPEILPYLTRQLMECRNCLVESSCARVETRFASLFIGLSERLGQTAEGGCFIPLPLSRQELADLTATTLETAIRVMSRWSREGVVTTRRDGFLVHDKAGLAGAVMGVVTALPAHGTTAGAAAGDWADEGDLWQPPRFDRALIRKYDQPGPRYTSYPTAPFFRDDFGTAGYERLLRKSAESAAPLSLYVHVPFCDTRCLFCGCNVTIARDRNRARTYLAYLEKEVARVAALAGASGRRVVQVHWGGGTPTFLPPEEIATLDRILRQSFAFDPEVEYGVEVDPRRCTPDQLDALAAAGVNRLSLGVQDLDPRVQEAVHRIQPLAMTREVVDGARQRGIKSLNVDLIYGLPHQTAASFAQTVDAVLTTLAPDRLAIFNFAYLPEMLHHQRALDATAMPGPDEKLTILEEVVATLTGAGHVFIGMDHFARPEDPLAQELRSRRLTRNFQGYSTHGDADLLGFGASSIGQAAGGYAQNVRGVGEYQQVVGAGGLATSRGLELSADDELRRDVIVRLMCHFRLDKAELEERHGIDFDATFGAALDRLRPLADDGLVTLGRDRLEVTPLGRLLVRNVAMAFDAYLEARPGQRFSRTV